MKSKDFRKHFREASMNIFLSSSRNQEGFSLRAPQIFAVKQCVTLELDSEALDELCDDVLCDVLVDNNDELDESLVDVEELDDEPPDDELVDEDGELSELLVDELL